MYKIVFGVVGGIVAGALIGAATASQAGVWGAIATSGWPTQKSEAFKVEAFGFDFRVYEWKSKTDPDTICTVAIGNVKHAPYMGLNCFRKSN
jgi:hypothetical protein